MAATARFTLAGDPAVNRIGYLMRHAAPAIDLEPLDVRRSVERERGVSWRTGVG